MKKQLTAFIFGSTALVTSMSFLPLADVHAGNFTDSLDMNNLSRSVFANPGQARGHSENLFNSMRHDNKVNASAYTNVSMSKEDKILWAAKSAAATYRYMGSDTDTDQFKANGKVSIEKRLDLGEQYVFGGTNIEGDEFSQGGHIFYKWNKETGRHELNVAFRGTETGADWGYNFDVKKAKNVFFAGKEMSLHSGFYNRYMAMRDSLTKNISKILLEKNITDFSKLDITVTGHSLGAGLAGIGAVDLKYYFNQIARFHKSEPVTSFDVITFAQPRFAGERTAKWISNYLGNDHITRIWGSYDPVAAVGLGKMGYKHVGRSGGYMLDNLSWVISKDYKALHSMGNYLDAILNKQKLIHYKGKVHGVGRQATRAANALKSQATKATKGVTNIFKNAWGKVWG